MYAYVFTLPVEPVEVGAVYTSLPLHCTLMQWFRVHMGPSDLVKHVLPILDRRGALELVSNSPALFGKNNDVPVHTLAYDSNLHELHSDLHYWLGEIDAEHPEPAWVGQGFKPHVTTKGEQSFPPGSCITANVVHLFTSDDPYIFKKKTAIAEFSLL